MGLGKPTKVKISAKTADKPSARGLTTLGLKEADFLMTLDFVNWEPTIYLLLTKN
jgi:hypothetical protein